MGIYENGVYNYNNSLKEEIIYTNGNYDILAWKRQEISFQRKEAIGYETSKQLLYYTK